MKEKNNWISLFLFVWWFAGIAAASGSWKILAIFVPPYAWYLFAERLLEYFRI
jgi:hypothetical protein